LPHNWSLSVRQQGVRAELDQALSGQATTASGQGQRLTKSDSDKGAAIIPIDAQPLGTDGFGRAAERYDREDFRPSSIGRTRSGLREPPRPETSFRPAGLKSIRNRVSRSQFGRSKAWLILLQRHVQTRPE